MIYEIQESEKYEGCYNIYDKASGTRVHYFAEGDDKNKQRAEDWVKQHTPPVNESWQGRFMKKLDELVHQSGLEKWDGRLTKFIIDAMEYELSTARQEAKAEWTEEIRKDIKESFALLKKGEIGFVKEKDTLKVANQIQSTTLDLAQDMILIGIDSLTSKGGRV